MYANSHPITRQIKTLKISSVGCNFAYLAHIWDIMVNSLEIIIMKNMICRVTTLKVTWRRLFHATLPIDCVYILLQTQQYQGYCVLDDVLMAAKRFIFCSRSTLKAWQKLCDLWFFLEHTAHADLLEANSKTAFHRRTCSTFLAWSGVPWIFVLPGTSLKWELFCYISGFTSDSVH